MILEVMRGQKMKNTKNAIWKKIIGITSIVIFLSLGAFILWAMLPHQPMEEVEALLLSDENVLVLDNAYLSFLPIDQSDNNDTKSTGFIIYPGARVSASSYAFIGRELALQGISVYILKPPLRMAILEPNGAQSIIDANPDIQHWYVGGHSLGGATASLYAFDHLNTIDGIIYLAAYPVESKDFSKTAIKALTIYASEDGFATVEDIAKFDYLQPENYTKVLIEGGNHEQFGYYGHQKGDNPALISRDEQQSIIVQDILKFILQK